MKSRYVMMMAGVMAVALSANAETYQVDPAHSTVGFSVKHLAISTVRGVFTNFSGTIEVDAKKPEASSAKASKTSGSLSSIAFLPCSFVLLHQLRYSFR